MSRIGISYDDVVEAIDSLQKLDETPTIEKIRVYLGETGSNSTISKYLRKYRNQFHSQTFTHLKNSSTPDIVQQAVERVWQDMRGQTDQEILTIKAEAQKMVEDSENRARIAETNFNDLKNKQDRLVEAYNAECAEKELLLLDIKKLREEHTLLQERFSALETRYADMQSLNSKHLTDLSNAHKSEVTRLEESIQLQLENHNRLVSEIKDRNEQMRHQYMLEVDNFNVQKKKLSNQIENLQSQLKDALSYNKKLESELKVFTVERDQAIDRLNDQDEKWTYFNDKFIVFNDMLNKISETTKWDQVFKNINCVFEESIEKKFLEWNEKMEWMNNLTFIKKVLKDKQDV